jgi:hypothetical protein
MHGTFVHSSESPSTLPETRSMPRLSNYVLFLLSFAGALPAAESDRILRDKVEWARLKTGSPYWNRHSERDVHVLRLMRTETSLEISDTWHSARADSLEELGAYQFIFAESVAPLSGPELDKVAEYLRRGGFLLIDACVAVSINPDAQTFLDAQIKTLSRKFPELRVETLQPNHELFSVYFKMTKTPPQTKSGTNPRWANGSTEPLRGVFLGERMIGVISLSGFQCGFGQNPNPSEVIRMVTNIYIYAMSR